MDLFKQLEAKAKRNPKTIIFPESDEPRVIEAVKIILKKKLAKVILIDNGFSNIGLNDSDNLTIIDISFSAQFIQEYLKIKKKKKKDYTYVQAEADLLNPMTFACMLLKENFADGIIAGSVYPTSEVLRNAISLVGLQPKNDTVSSFFLFTFPTRHRLNDKVFVYGDAGVIPVPTAEQLSEIAIQTAKNFKKLTGKKPRVAFLSFSTKGSAEHESLGRIREAMKLTQKREPSLIMDGELQFDAAFVPEVAKRKNPKGKIKGDANVFIFPDLNAGNIAYKITERIGGASATGPIVQGLAKPVMDLSRGCSSDDIVKMALVLSLI
ncbi:MAG: phosphate acetyltransferase [Ignavibacteriae bacterium]|nr:phosphate acetyltransferase [Ignavibacteriota bacterium]MCB9242970.1 phosphate acetyltransferase [Ignavibacteriales bacterium]